MSIDKEREEFESVYNKTGENISLAKMPNNPDRYVSMVTHYAFHAWMYQSEKFAKREAELLAEIDSARNLIERLKQGEPVVSDGYAVLNISELRELTFSFNGRERLEQMILASRSRRRRKHERLLF